MAVAFKAALGNIGNNISGTTIVIGVGGTIAVGDLVVVRWAADNLSATTPTATCSDGTANVYTSQRQGAVNATAAAGCAGGIFTCKATASLSGGNITVTLSGAVVGKCGYAESFTGAENTVRSAVPAATTGTATAASATITGTVNTGDLVLGFIANETRAAITGDTDTLNGSWSALTSKAGGGTSGQDATSVTAAGQYKIATASGAQTYNVTAVASEWVMGVVVLQASPDPAITQAAYQFFDDAGTESGAPSLAALNTGITPLLVGVDGFGVLRVRLQNTTANAGFNTDDYQLQYAKNGGAWTSITTGTTTVRAYNNPNLTNISPTSNRLGAGTGSFAVGLVSETGDVANFPLAASNYTELVYSLTLLAANLADADVLTFRVLYNGASTQMTYTVTPTITIKVPVALAGSSGGVATTAAALARAVPLDASGGGTVYSDNFNRADTTSAIAGGAGLGSSWQGSRFYIASNTAQRDAGGGDYVVYQQDLGSADHWIEVDVANNSQFGVINARRPSATDDIVNANGYLFFMDPGNADVAKLGKSTNGVYADVSVYTSTAFHGNSAKLRLECQGNNIRCYHNGTKIIDITDTSFPTGNYVGLNTGAVVSGGTAYDNFRVGPLPYGAGGGSAGVSTVAGDLTITAGAGPVALAASSAGVATTTAVASMTRGLAGSSAGTSTVTSAAGVTRGLAGSAAGVSTTTAAIARGVPLGSSAAGVSTTTATLVVALPLAGSAGGVATATGTLTAGPAGAFTPDSIPGLALWLEADQLPLGALASWPNPGTSADAPMLGSPNPVVTASLTPTGLSAVRFLTGEGRVRMTSSGLGTAFTLVYLARMTPGATNWIGRIVAAIYPPANVLFGYWNGWQDVAYDEGFVAPDVRTPNSSDWKLYSADGVPGLDRLFSDGALLGSTSTAQGWKDTFAISGYDPTTTSETCDCDVAAVLIYDNTLSDTDRGKVEGYLRTKYLTVTGATVSLSASADGSSSASGALDIGSIRALVGAAAGLATTTSGVTVNRGLQAGAAGTSTASAVALSDNYAVTATASGVATASASLTRTMPVTATVVGVATTTASLSVFHPLASGAVGTATTTADLIVFHPLVAGAVGGATASGTLTVTAANGIAATVSGTSTASGTLRVAWALAGSAVGAGTTIGAVSRGVPLGATVNGTSTATGSVARGVPLDAVAAGSATTTASVRLALGLGASSDGLSTITAGLVLVHALVALSRGASTVTADLKSGGALGTASAAGTSTAVGTLEAAVIVPTYGMWNGEVFDGMQYGNKQVVDYLLVPS